MTVVRYGPRGMIIFATWKKKHKSPSPTPPPLMSGTGALESIFGQPPPPGKIVKLVQYAYEYNELAKMRFDVHRPPSPNAVLSYNSDKHTVRLESIFGQPPPPPGKKLIGPVRLWIQRTRQNAVWRTQPPSPNAVLSYNSDKRTVRSTLTSGVGIRKMLSFSLGRNLLAG